MKYPDYLAKMAAHFRRLPGVGGKMAERFAFELTRWPKERLQELAQTLSELKDKILNCPECGCLIDKERCLFCQPERAKADQICVVAHIRDIFLIEETREYKGLYHVVASQFHPTEGRLFHMPSVERLKERIHRLELKEVILAFDATEAGDALSLFLKKELSNFPLKLTRLAFGIPLGSSFDFIDSGTLGRALTGRQHYQRNV